MGTLLGWSKSASITVTSTRCARLLTSIPRSYSPNHHDVGSPMQTTTEERTVVERMPASGTRVPVAGSYSSHHIVRPSAVVLTSVRIRPWSASV